MMKRELWEFYEVAEPLLKSADQKIISIPWLLCQKFEQKKISPESLYILFEAVYAIQAHDLAYREICKLLNQYPKSAWSRCYLELFVLHCHPSAHEEDSHDYETLPMPEFFIVLKMLYPEADQLIEKHYPKFTAEMQQQVVVIDQFMETHQISKIFVYGLLRQLILKTDQNTIFKNILRRHDLADADLPNMILSMLLIQHKETIMDQLRHYIFATFRLRSARSKTILHSLSNKELCHFFSLDSLDLAVKWLIAKENDPWPAGLKHKMVKKWRGFRKQCPEIFRFLADDIMQHRIPWREAEALDCFLKIPFDLLSDIDLQSWVKAIGYPIDALSVRVFDAHDNVVRRNQAWEKYFYVAMSSTLRIFLAWISIDVTGNICQDDVQFLIMQYLGLTGFTLHIFHQVEKEALLFGRRHLYFEPLLPPNKPNNLFDRLMQDDDTDNKPLSRAIITRLDTDGSIAELRKQGAVLVAEQRRDMAILSRLKRLERFSKQNNTGMQGSAGGNRVSDNDFPAWFKNIVAGLNTGNFADELPRASLSEHRSTLFTAHSTTSALTQDIYDDRLTSGNTHVIPSK